MKIQNFQDLATNDQRLKLLHIIEAGLEVIDTGRAISHQVLLRSQELNIAGKIFSLKDVNRIIVIGAGKCSLDAALALEKILGDKLTRGLVIDTRSNDHHPKLQKIELRVGDHPYPSEQNIAYTREMLGLLDDLEPSDLVINLVSGGGSTLLCQPPESLSASDEKRLLDQLFRKGATIQEINVVRKHLSFARGGGVAKRSWPARVISLIFSDVPGDEISFISSGPTVRDDTTIEDARGVISRYDDSEQFLTLLDNLIETPKEEKYFSQVDNQLIVSNRIALEAMSEEAQKQNLNSRIVTTRLAGNNREIGSQILRELKQEPEKTVLLYGGETTVNISGYGLGGRNRDLAMSLLPQIDKNEIIASVASDGRDNGDSAGAFADLELKKLATSKDLDVEEYLINNDSQTFFSKLGYDIRTGPTGSNVADLIIAIKY